MKSSIIEVIEKRKSIRTYETRELTSDHLNQIDEYLKNEDNLVGPLGRKAKFEVIQIKTMSLIKG